MNNLMSIAITEVKASISGLHGDISDLLRAAMKITKNHWLVTSEADRLNAAVGGVMVHYGQDSEEYKRLSWEMKNINRLNAALSAAMSGVSVNFESVVSEINDDMKPVGILALWKEVDK